MFRVGFHPWSTDYPFSIMGPPVGCSWNRIKPRLSTGCECIIAFTPSQGIDFPSGSHCFSNWCTRHCCSGLRTVSPFGGNHLLNESQRKPDPFFNGFNGQRKKKENNKKVEKKKPSTYLLAQQKSFVDVVFLEQVCGHYVHNTTRPGSGYQ